MRILKSIDKALTKAEEAVLIALLSIMVVMAFLQVVLRNLFSSGIFWADILLRHLLLWLGFLGAAIATSENRHINIDALTRFSPPKLRSLLAVITDVFAVLICYFLFRASETFLRNELADKTVVYGEIPAWYSEIIIPTGFALLIFHFFIRAILSVQAALNKGGKE